LLEDRTVPATYQWTGLGTTTNWDDPENWGGTGFPHLSGDVAQLTSPLSANATVNVEGNFTIGQLLIGDATSNFTYTVSNAGGSLTFADPSGTASISKTNAGGGADNINAPLILADNVMTNDSTANGLSIGGSISGSGALSKFGTGRLTLPRSGNSITSLIINGGTVGFPAGTSSPGGTAAYTNSGSYTYSPVSNDIIAGLQPSSISNGSNGAESTGGTGALTDQSITANNPNTYTVGNNASLTYCRFQLTTFVLGRQIRQDR
jgi:hypothetical protein